MVIRMKLGSLFDGAGTFPFASQQFGIKSCWASEIESFPISVTTKRFPNMLHLGDITKINGAEIESVDVITFGSPCQDLSVAGKQAGLAGERSGLFMEAVRIIKEMRRKTNGKYPRYAVWENVPGAFSSNDREDFRVVLEELCKIKDDSTFIPRPSIKGGSKGKWQNAGLILADEYSIAWRVLDAQFWGVPQRRRRIFLVADFRGQSAGEILFERNGLSRSFAESRKAWKGITPNTTFGSCKSGKCFDVRGNGNGNIVPTITGDHNNRVTDYTSVVVFDGENITSKANASNPQEGDPCHTIGATGAKRALVCFGYDMYNQESTDDKTRTLKTPIGGDDLPVIVIPLENRPTDGRLKICKNGIVQTLTGRMGTGGGNEALLLVGVDTYNQNLTGDKAKNLLAGHTDCDGVPCVAMNLTQDPVPNEKVFPCLSTGNPITGQANLAVCYSLDSLSSNSMKSDNKYSGFHETEKHRTLDTLCHNPTCNQGGTVICVATQQGGAEIAENLCPTVTAAAGMSGNNQPFICVEHKTIGALCTSDSKGVSNQMVQQNKLLCFSVPISLNGKISGTLDANYYKGTGERNGTEREIIAQINQSKWVVRRVVPIECARLQGMPDWWCKDIPHSDSAEYKMWGNGMALPCVLYVMEGIAIQLRKEILSNLEVTV